MYNDYLKHYGILGMRWGKRRASVSQLGRMSKKNDKLNSKLEKTMKKAEKNQAKVDKLTSKLAKRGSYLTTIGYTMAKNTGAKLSKKLNRAKKLEKKMNKIKAKIEKNKQLMRTSVKDLPKDQMKAGRSIVDSVLRK